MRVTALVDNKKLPNRPDLKAEKGLSYHITTDNHTLLFDVGGGHVFYDNANAMGIEISDVDAAIISHRHHDHANGLPCFFQHNQKAKLYLRDCGQETYSFHFLSLKLNVGMDISVLKDNQKRLSYIKETTEILPNIFLVLNQSTAYPRPLGNKYLYSKSLNTSNKDAFNHELFMVIKEHDGIVIFTGCAHAGVLNMIETAYSLFPNEKIKGVVGGFHLVGLPLFNTLGGNHTDITLIAETLKQYPITKMYTGHCTGTKAYKILKTVLHDKINYFPTGSSVTI
ncbi:MBL fold metallo-hydrolase [Vibrio sp. Of7-15]|uniref:MBL fold metallo-hydrolase n=1 Tax=Vibrio sp. Of7-15 TaxID=2724879 RepID=UPI001EF1860D|nr:MBL fold metallo-hydrolase [Vibrio sp. Of7-15]MCG7499751.1 MBL fold metallo-hydrolase [Vibrio sp. Of7-15]